MCNDSRIEAKDGVFKAVGGPTEVALLVLAEKLGLSNEEQQKAINNARKADPDNNGDAASKVYQSR